MSVTGKSALRWLEIFGLLMILVLAAYLRLANVVDNPGWYSDEGTQLNLAQNFARGHLQYMAIDQSILIVARATLFPTVLATMFRFMGEGIGTLRVLTGLLGVLSVATLYIVVRRISGARLALLSALLLAIYPNAVIFSRIGFSYNLETPLVLLTCLGLWEYLKDRPPKWLLLAALAIGLGGLSDLTMFTLVLPFVIVVSARRWRDLIWSLPLIALPFSAYALLMLVSAPQAFVYDLNFILFRLGGLPIWIQPIELLVNYGTLLAQDYWIALGLIGLFLLKPIRWRQLSLLMFLLPLLLIGRGTSGLATLGYRYLIPLLPFVAIGLAQVIESIVPPVIQTIRNGLQALLYSWHWPRRGQALLLTLLGSLSLFVLVISPLLIAVVLLANQITTGLRTPVDDVLIDPLAARAASQFINRESSTEDVVIASPALAWLLHAQVADFQIALAAEGKSTAHFPTDVPADRFAFDPRYTHAKFVVIDRVWRNWAALAMPEVATMMSEVVKWPLAFQAGEIDVYRNPAR